MPEEEKTPETKGIDIAQLETAFKDLEASSKANDEAGVKDALNALKKLIDDALGDAEEEPGGDEENDPFNEKLEKYK